MGLDRTAVVRALRETGTIGPDSELVGLTERPIGIGHTAQTLLLSATWTGPGPSSRVAKVPSPDPRSARTAASLGLYRREVRFYAELAPGGT